jgi:hypothetical protein
VHLSARSEAQPDVAVLRLRADRYAGNHPSAADVLLVIEVSDATLRFDSDVKAFFTQSGVAMNVPPPARQQRLVTFDRGQRGCKERWRESVLLMTVGCALSCPTLAFASVPGPMT